MLLIYINRQPSSPTPRSANHMKMRPQLIPEALFEKYLFHPPLPMHYSGNSEILEHHHAAVTHDYSSLQALAVVEGIAVVVYIFLIIKISRVRLNGMREICLVK
ncbi:hypothetical protein CDAR_240461 [Caerostris darwini]|uniref:Uncharacterized protein n=1 Tax=Caerostris darwini TaxID=1538125 RepID=A0AAV4PQ50_9ARAC|nr:hypothetical protein CDAR_240461 [Caerostris darwini]